MGPEASGGTQLIWLRLDLPAQALEEMTRWLSPDERQRAARFRFSRDRNRYIAGRAGVRAALGQVLGRDPATLRFSYGPQGKPVLDRDTGATPVHFNVSHSQGVALLALHAEAELGVDIELVRPVPDALAIAERLFAEEECRVMAVLSPDERDLVFARLWTRKEALLKSIGRGLSHPANTFAVPPDELVRPVEIELRDGSARHTRWLQPTPAPPPGYVVALATAGGPGVGGIVPPST